MAFSYKNSGDDNAASSRPKNILTPGQAWEKAKVYCAYQERCHQEVKDKLYGFGLHRKDVEILLSRLIEENYLNEERFAIQYAGGHFRLKKWGKIKIQHALRQKGISDYCIRRGLAAIDRSDYLSVLEKLAASKWKAFGKLAPAIKNQKCFSYLMQKGFEPELIAPVLKKL